MPGSVNIREIILFGTSLFLAFFLFKGGCKDQKEKDDLVKSIVTYKDSIKFYKLIVNGNPMDIAYSQSLLLENKKQLEAVIAKNDTLAKIISKFRKVAETTIINQYTTIKGDTIRLKGDSIPYDFKSFHVNKDSAWYHFVGTIAPKFFSIDSLIIPNKQSIVVGDKKLGFLRGTEKRVEVLNSNPLIHVNKIENYVIQGPKRWYQTTAFKFGAGALAGAAGFWKLTR